jgi:hypothetical protein
LLDVSKSAYSQLEVAQEASQQRRGVDTTLDDNSDDDATATQQRQVSCSVSKRCAEKTASIVVELIVR